MVDSDVPDFSQLGLVTDGTWRSWAVFSADRKYRYMLGRCWVDTTPLEEASMRSTGAWPPSPATLLYVMLNPSTADALKADPTVRKCIGFAKQHQARRIIVVNLFALRSTDPNRLTSATDPIGEHNEAMIEAAIALVGDSRQVAAWGRLPSKRVRDRAKRSIAHVKERAHHLQCLGWTKDGEPRHPLMLSYETPFESFARNQP